MNHLDILTSLCDLPTAPYRERHVVDWLLRWAARHNKTIRTCRDRAGNLYLEYRHPACGPRRPPLVLEAHMDHPGFVATRQRRDGRIEALFRGGVKPSHFKNARVRFWLPASAERPGQWVPTRVLAVTTIPNQRHLKVLLAAPKDKEILPPNTLGMWDLPDAAHKNNHFAARVCDDLAGLAAIICALDHLAVHRTPAHVIALCSRAEEVGFAGVLAVCENRWLPRNAPVIGIETSRASPGAPQGAGPIIRVGDRTGIFSPGLTHFLTQTAGRLADDDPDFRYQRKLMDGGTCSSTAFAAYGYDAAGLCLALGNYHNMRDETGDDPHAPAAAPPRRRGRRHLPAIASETIHLGDFHQLVGLLIQTAAHIRGYRPGMNPIRLRLANMHRAEQKQLLYARNA